MPTSRVEAFSDGVLAIIITVMVLELRQPAGTGLAALWSTTGTSLLAYLLSFVYVGIYWTNHHHMFQLTERVTGGILWANLGLLFCLSLFPFTTQWTDATHYARTPVVVYGVNLLAAGVAYYILQWTIIRNQGRDSELRKAIGSDLKGKISPVCYVVGCVAAALWGAGTGVARPGIWIAVACYVAVALLWVIPDRRIETVIAIPDPRPAPGAEAGAERGSRERPLQVTARGSPIARAPRVSQRALPIPPASAISRGAPVGAPFGCRRSVWSRSGQGSGRRGRPCARTCSSWCPRSAW
jgi:uncharacterized membrane protein